METLELLRINLHSAHDAFLGTAADLTQAMLDWVPPGLAHPIGERYAHLAVSEDWLIHGVAQGDKPWFMSSWRERLGLGHFNVGMSSEQARAIHVELAPVLEYTRAVFADTEAYLDTLTPADVDRVIDMSAVGYGSVAFPVWLSTYIIGHAHDIMGEISALKGCQGARGYPF